MNLSHVSLITDELHLTYQQVEAVSLLLEEDARGAVGSGGGTGDVVRGVRGDGRRDGAGDAD